MYIVIIGLGEVGRHLVRVLEPEGHEIVAIDSDPEIVRQVDEQHDVLTIAGYGAKDGVLKEAGVGRADLVVAVTDHDEVNLIATLASKQLGAKRAVARTQGQEWSDTHAGIRHDVLGIDVVINPSVLVAGELVKIARSHGAVEVIDVAHEQIEMVQVELDDKTTYVGRSISRVPMPLSTLIAAIVRDDQLFVPGGSDVLKSGDRLYLLGRASEIVGAQDLFTRHRETQRAWIAGGGVTGESIARRLLEHQIEVLLVESSLERADRLSATLKGATVVHGDCTDSRILDDAGVSRFDMFMAATSSDEVNIMAALLASRMGVRRTAAIVERPDYGSIHEKLGIDVVVSPRAVASDHILRFCRKTEVTSVSVLQGGQAELIELIAPEGCAVVNRPIRKLDLPRGALIGGIVHGDSVVVPRGDDVIAPGDSVVVLATDHARRSIERLFRRSMFHLS